MKERKEKTCIVIPAYNEETEIAKVIKGLKKEGYNDIIVVNDGSKDKTKETAEKENVIVISHIVNRGLGGALGTGISAALKEGADNIVTFDADGQHNPKDIKKLIAPIKNGKADAVIGSRLLNPEGMPHIRRIANNIGNIITYALFGLWTTDSQSGLRAFSRDAGEKIKIRTNKMEVSSEIIKEIHKNKLRFMEVPIEAIYTNYSLSKPHGQGFITGLKTLFKLILRKLME
jgi:UDP-N-acetylglucosamine---dolichyl-phosphate N-acetylglucosaminyltransferase